jgi:hypothetical protein
MISVAGTAQQPASIHYTEVSCMTAGKMPVLQMQLNGIDGKNELRGYFRRAGTADWCMVIGDNLGSLSTVTMPVFDDGVELEYYFLVADGKRVVARSPKIYRCKVTQGCENPSSRHYINLRLDCSQNGAGSLPASMGAGYSLSESAVDTRPPRSTPDSPTGGGSTTQQ